MTTAPTNEMLALADDDLLNGFRTEVFRNEAAQYATCDYRDEILRRLATTPSGRDVREALDELLRCANAIVGADPSDSEAAEAFTMFDLARVKARKCLALDAAAPAAGGDAWPKRPFAFAVRRAPDNGPDQWRLFMDEAEAREESAQLDGDYEGLYRVGDRRSAIAALQAPAHSDALRDMPPTQEYVLRAMVKNYADGNLWDHLDREVCTKAADEIKSLRAALTAPAAMAPAVSEADVGRMAVSVREVAAQLSSERIQGWANPFVSTLSDASDMLERLAGTEKEKPVGQPDVVLSRIQSAAQGGGAEGCIPTDGEPSFVLLGRDPQAPELVEQWARDRLRYEPDSDKPSKAFKIAREMRGFKKRNPELGMAAPSDPPSQEASAPPIAGGR